MSLYYNNNNDDKKPLYLHPQHKGDGAYVAVRLVGGLGGVSPRLAAEAVDAGLLLLLLQLQRLDLRLQLLQLVLQVFALLHVLQPGSLKTHVTNIAHRLSEATLPEIYSHLSLSISMDSRFMSESLKSRREDADSYAKSVASGGAGGAGGADFTASCSASLIFCSICLFSSLVFMAETSNLCLSCSASAALWANSLASSSAI
ncbi:hypothetical protein EYF80_041509 [Liparis tanakae]|uniref:Uncharacterized protein n=1 Tax=Liparis tanakae TaxID=230148 RepID=A0A4Z2G463_9TELE|nr:hypothetical protein EYF80_041509 [Liparis tanakae]